MQEQLDQLRSDLQQAKEKQDATNQKLDSIQADTTRLLDKLNNIPGIPQDVLDLAASINASAGAISEKATSIDEQVPEEETGGDEE